MNLRSSCQLVYTTSATVVLEEDVGLDDGIDEYEHIFTLYQIILDGVRGFGTTETFTFGKMQYTTLLVRECFQQLYTKLHG